MNKAVLTRIAQALERIADQDASIAVTVANPLDAAALNKLIDARLDAQAKRVTRAAARLK